MRALRRLLSYDEAILLFVHRWQHPWATWSMQLLTRLGDASSWTALAVFFLLEGSPASQKRALLVGGGATFGALLAQVLKRVSRRRRPDAGIAGFRALALNPDAFSFPSGHTAAAVGVAMALSGDGHLGPLASSFAAGVGFSRVYLGAHYPLDVAAGAFLGLLAGAAARVLAF